MKTRIIRNWKTTITGLLLAGLLQGLNLYITGTTDYKLLIASGLVVIIGGLLKDK